tara:strand:- start:228 stop:698 length:471 start_codon:yes stop_codon:yes gene_type:complete
MKYIFLFLILPFPLLADSDMWKSSEKWYCENVESTLIRFNGKRDALNIKDKLWLDFNSMEAKLWHDQQQKNVLGKIIRNTMFSNNQSENLDGIYISESSFVIDWGSAGKRNQTFQRTSKEKNIYWQNKVTSYVVPQGYQYAGKTQTLEMKRRCIPI